jgi:hypothetical protein
MVRTETVQEKNYEDVVSQRTTISIKCDAADCPVDFKWTLNSDGADPELPDGAYRFIIFAGFIGGKWTFCSKYCLLHWLKTYKIPKSPRELREEAEEAAKLQKEKDEAAEKLLSENGVDAGLGTGDLW